MSECTGQDSYYHGGTCINNDCHVLFQVNDFLSGAAPLNLTMRLGDHMMLIQLQLSTVNQASSSRRKSTIQISSSSPPPYPTPPPSAPSSPTSEPSSSSSSSSASSSSSSSSSQSKKVRVPLLSPGGLYQAPPPGKSSSSSSLSGQTIQPHRNFTPQPDAFSRKSSSGGARISSETRETSGEPPAKKPKLDTKALAEASKNLTQTLKQLSSEVLTTRPETQEPAASSTTSSSTTTPATSQIPKKEVSKLIKFIPEYFCQHICNFRNRNPPQQVAPVPVPAAPVAQMEVPVALVPDMAARGTVVEEPSLSPCTTMAREFTLAHSQVGFRKGIFKTLIFNNVWNFTGTLNPALQDENGQPKRDITTIVHILNDLLCAQYKAYGGSSSGSSRSKHSHHHRHHHHHHNSTENKSSQHSDAKTALFGNLLHFI